VKFDSIIIGAGAAGLYSALHAGRRGRRVLVLEHNEAPGAKILISGGGRCNFTNLNASNPVRFVSGNPHFARSALTRHTQDDFVALVRKHGIAFYEKTLGQLFCEGPRSSQKIVGMLMDECAAVGVEVRCGVNVSGVRRGERFVVETSEGVFESETLVIATGGLSIPKLGATPFAYRVAEQFGVAMIPPRAGLVPLTFSEADMTWMRPLSGVSAEVSVAAGKTAFREAALFTHKGLSGPAVLCEAAPARRQGDWKDEALVAFVQETLKGARLKPHGTEGYAKAEVTVGGIDTDALSQQTLEARAVPGLFFIGEAVDVTGWLGGYNFQWAWSSGWAAGQAI
jgi:predicted Rossmann fold flavoprotein